MLLACGRDRRVQELALDAVQTVAVQTPGGAREIDIKKYAKVEKLPGGSIEDCKVLAGALVHVFCDSVKKRLNTLTALRYCCRVRLHLATATAAP